MEMLPLSHKVLLFPVKEMSSKERFIEYADEHKPTVVEFREKIYGSKSSTIYSKAANKSFLDRFAKASKPLSQKVNKAFETTEIDAQFKIKPLSKDMVSVTISAPIDELQNSVDIVSKEIGNGLSSLKNALEK